MTLSDIALIISGVVYLIVCIEQALNGNYGMAVAMSGYVISTAGYVMMLR